MPKTLQRRKIKIKLAEMLDKCENCRNNMGVNYCSYTIKDGTVGCAKYIDEFYKSDDLQIYLCRKCYKELLDLTVKMKAKDTSIIPEGPYCYIGLSYEKGVLHTKVCPYFDHIEKGGSQSDGYCHYIEEGDSKLDGTYNEEGGCDLLWDQVKSCGINDEINEKDLS